MIFQHFGRLFLPGTLKNVPCSLNELLVNFGEESSGIGRFCRPEVPTDGQTSQFLFFFRTEPVGHPLAFEAAKSANPTRFLSKIDQQLIEGAGDVFHRPQEKKPVKVLKNPVLFSGTMIVGLNSKHWGAE